MIQEPKNMQVDDSEFMLTLYIQGPVIQGGILNLQNELRKWKSTPQSQSDCASYLFQILNPHENPSKTRRLEWARWLLEADKETVWSSAPARYLLENCVAEKAAVSLTLDKVRGRLKNREIKEREWWNPPLCLAKPGDGWDFGRRGNSSAPHRPQHISVCASRTFAPSSSDPPRLYHFHISAKLLWNLINDARGTWQTSSASGSCQGAASCCAGLRMRTHRAPGRLFLFLLLRPCRGLARDICLNKDGSPEEVSSFKRGDNGGDYWVCSNGKCSSRNSVCLDTVLVNGKKWLLLGDTIYITDSKGYSANLASWKWEFPIESAIRKPKMCH